MDDLLTNEQIDLIQAWFASSDGLLICAGAGMGVDSGLPDFRGNQGFWRAYPALGQRRMAFTSIANPQAFVDEPRLAWGFYGHRLQLYRDTVPHHGFQMLQHLSQRFEQGSFVFTSNVDRQFQTAGFAAEQVLECHGSIHQLQCSVPCHAAIWSASAVDTPHCELLNAWPTCPQCGAIARPNILMFGDWSWLAQRTEQQHARFAAWRKRVKQPLVIELGAGTAIPSVRMQAESTGRRLIRINPREAQVTHPDGVPISLGALAGLRLLNRVLDA
ncbi:MAG: Sir2 family NAD-dependent protein deacetylase [Pseudomonadota bacterium]|nr:Sir2 family NAD-dependent protein deacetylase [Pseudomonadota bacterium]